MVPDELIQAVLTGDQRAWTDLYRLLYDELARYFGRRLGADDADDLVQSTLTAVFVKLPRFEQRGDASFRRWVYGIARIEVQEALRQHARRRRRHDALARERLPPPTSPSSKLERQRKLEFIEGELDKLTAMHRKAIENDLAGGDAGTLAERENISRASARVARSRARKQLRERVQRRIAQPGVGSASASPSTPAK